MGATLEKENEGGLSLQLKQKNNQSSQILDDEHNKEHTLTCETAILKKSYQFNQEHETFTSLRISSTSNPNVRKSIDLVVVLDKSQSMEGPKLSLCKHTVGIILDVLKETDRFSLCTFDIKASVSPLSKMTLQRKRQLKKDIKHISSGQKTNISAGLFSGIHELEKISKKGNENKIQCIFLLTDGNSNAGISLPEQLLSAFKTSFRTFRNLSVFTFGYGDCHNDRILRQISEQGNGMYYYIENERDLPYAFGSCLGGRFSVVAQNISIIFHTINQTQVEKVCQPQHNSKEDLPSSAEKNEDANMVHIGDLCAEEHHDVLFKIKLPCADILPCLKPSNEKWAVLEFTVEYTDTFSGAKKILKTSTFTHRPVCPTLVDPGYNPSVVQACNRIKAADAMDCALQMARLGGNKRDQARRKLKHAVTGIKSTYHFLESTSELLIKAEGLVDDLEDCLQGIHTDEIFTTTGSKRIAAKAQSHWKQRSNLSAPSCSPDPYGTFCIQELSFKFNESVEVGVESCILASSFSLA